ncbi:MAG: hypothetical protein ACO23M_07210, partial [Vulcanococcus sp.]
YSMKLGTLQLERNLLDNTSIQQSGGQKIAVSILDFNVGGNRYQPGETAHLSCGDLTIKQDGSLIFIPAKGFVGAVPQVTYNLTDGTRTGPSSTADIQVTSYQLIDTDEWVTGKEGQTITGELTAGAHLDNGKQPQHLEITAVLDPTGRPLSKDASSGHFVGEIRDENNEIAGKIDIDPTSGHYTFTPNPHWTGNIGTDSLNPISYVVRDENGVEDGSFLGIKIDPTWATPPLTGQTPVPPGNSAGNVQVGSGELGAYYLVKEGERFDPAHPQSTGRGEIGDLRIDNHGSVSFAYDASRGNTWANSHQDLVSMQRVDVATGDKTGTTPGVIRNPSGRAAGVPGFTRGNAPWKNPITGEVAQKPPQQSSGTLGFVERWVIYNAKGEVVGHYYVTADLKVTETVTHTYSTRRETGGGRPPRDVIYESGPARTSTEASITHIHAGAEAPTAQERAQNSGIAHDSPDGSESGSDDPTQGYADYLAAIGLLSEDIQTALKELHITSAKTVIDEHFKETIIAETDQGELRLHLSDGLRLDTTALNKDFLLAHPDLNPDSSGQQKSADNEDQHPNLDTISEFALNNTGGNKPPESDDQESQTSLDQPATGIEGAQLAAALKTINENIKSEQADTKSVTSIEDVNLTERTANGSGEANADNTADNNTPPSDETEAETTQNSGSFLQRLVQKFQSTAGAPTADNANPAAQDVATSTLADPFVVLNEVKSVDDPTTSESTEEYQPLIDPQENQDHLMQ